MKLDIDELEREARSAADPRSPADEWGLTPEKTLALCARIRELEDGIRTMLRSAYPNPVEHPTMTKAWAVAHVLLEKGATLP